uniref:Uncharacterized protein n=1 Tax=Romanomermis culicivorax TaxID=13658 RepID=A0A915KAQ2_ROMCU
MRTTDKPCTQQTLPPSTSRTKRSKMPSEQTTRPPEQHAQQKAREMAGQTRSQTGATSRPNKCCMPTSQIAIVPFTSLITMMTGTKKKPNHPHQKIPKQPSTGTP